MSPTTVGRQGRVLPQPQTLLLRQHASDSLHHYSGPCHERLKVVASVRPVCHSFPFSPILLRLYASLPTGASTNHELGLVASMARRGISSCTSACVLIPSAGMGGCFDDF